MWSPHKLSPLKRDGGTLYLGQLWKYSMSMSRFLWSSTSNTASWCQCMWCVQQKKVHHMSTPWRYRPPFGGSTSPFGGSTSPFGANGYSTLLNTYDWLTWMTTFRSARFITIPVVGSTCAESGLDTQHQLMQNAAHTHS